MPTSTSIGQAGVAKDGHEIWMIHWRRMRHVVEITVKLELHFHRRQVSRCPFASSVLLDNQVSVAARAEGRVLRGRRRVGEGGVPVVALAVPQNSERLPREGQLKLVLPVGLPDGDAACDVGSELVRLEVVAHLGGREHDVLQGAVPDAAWNPQRRWCPHFCVKVLANR